MAEPRIPEQPIGHPEQRPREQMEGKPELPTPSDVMGERKAPGLPDIQVPEQPVSAAPTVASAKTETLQEVERILQDDLQDTYQQLPPDVKKEFKEMGEQTAKEIEGLMYQVKFHTKKVFGLLYRWLKIIPGVNRFFLKQEAKIKTDELAHLKEDLDKKRHLQ